MEQKAVNEQHKQHGEQGRGQARGHFIDAEEADAGRLYPVVENGFLVARGAIKRRDEIAVICYHHPRCFRETGLIVFRQRRPSDPEAVEQHADGEQQSTLHPWRYAARAR